MEDIKLSLEEQELLTSVASDEWLSVPNLEQEIKRYQSYAKAQIRELQEIKIEISAQDLQLLQALAQQTETPLQTMIANLLHQFVVHNLEG
ncbi:MAG: antitoxin [Leptolyngbyaceae cyanobacterium SM2_5_2]|nr:antitoxin [Leptolyngbyaceae cyanobacterium SM2_5_2]